MGVLPKRNKAKEGSGNPSQEGLVSIVIAYNTRDML